MVPRSVHRALSPRKNRKKMVSPVRCASGEEMHFFSLVHVHLKTKYVGLLLVVCAYVRLLQRRVGFVAAEGVAQAPHDSIL